MEVTHQAALGFAEARVAAEAETRQTLGREVTLAEIYAHPALRGTDPAAECAAELAMIAPNRPVAQAAAACHARGKRYNAVSDMYLPKEQIEAMLQKCGLDFLDGVFVSCEYGMQKRSGKLFKLFCSKLPCARRKSCLWGIAPARICRGSAGGYPLLFAAAANPAAIHQNPGGCRRWCRNCHLAKLLPESKSQCCAGGRAAWPAGGWLCHLAAWAARGYTGAKLVFLARDMYLVRQVYQLLYPEEETFYLKASRQSLLPACYNAQ